MFNENSFSEIEVADENKTYRIDKLVITDNEIFIIDYKTDAVPEVNNIPSSYKKQLTNYKNIIKKIYPNHTIKTFILWFENTTLTEVIL
jgi:ATP-dependent helicase/nuclease subunit A